MCVCVYAYTYTHMYIQTSQPFFREAVQMLPIFVLFFLLLFFSDKGKEISPSHKCSSVGGMTCWKWLFSLLLACSKPNTSSSITTNCLTCARVLACHIHIDKSNLSTILWTCAAPASVHNVAFHCITMKGEKMTNEVQIPPIYYYFFLRGSCCANSWKIIQFLKAPLAPRGPVFLRH